MNTETELLMQVLKNNNYKQINKDDFLNRIEIYFRKKTKDMEFSTEIHLVGENDYQLDVNNQFINTFSESIFYNPNTEQNQFTKEQVINNLNNLTDYSTAKFLAYNKLLFNDDDSSSLFFLQNLDDANEVVINFNYEKNDILLQKVSSKIGEVNDYSNNSLLSMVFYNKDHSIRKKFLHSLAKNQEFIYQLAFHLADSQNQIIAKTKLTNQDIESALAFLLNIGLENKENEDIDTKDNPYYRLLNNIYISYPKLRKSFESKNYFNYNSLEYFTKVFNTEQEASDDNLNNIKYYVSDPDGYTNLRKDKNTSSTIIEKIKSGEEVYVLDNSGDWWLVETKGGKQGYVHKSRIKS